jgi:hypothetical protein
MDAGSRSPRSNTSSKPSCLKDDDRCPLCGQRHGPCENSTRRAESYVRVLQKRNSPRNIPRIPWRLATGVSNPFYVAFRQRTRPQCQRGIRKMDRIWVLLPCASSVFTGSITGWLFSIRLFYRREKSRHTWYTPCDELEDVIARTIDAIPRTVSSDVFQSWRGRLEECIKRSGEYFEKPFPNIQKN